MRPLRLAIAGLGAIGLEVARRVDQGSIAGFDLVAVSVRDADNARRKLEGLRNPPRLLPLQDLAREGDVVVECLPSEHFLAVAEPTLRLGRILVPLSVGALLGHMHLVDLARDTGARIVVPTGAILGLDAVRAVAEGQVASVRLVSRKPPAALVGAPYLVEKGIAIHAIKEPVLLFSGSARDAVRGFPANLNVAASLALAGIGPDRTEVQVWADPTVRRNTHTITVHSDASDLRMTIENTPSEKNPRTGTITALSVIAALRRLTAPLVVGT
jgi:aspartate dehydrogenase